MTEARSPLAEGLDAVVGYVMRFVQFPDPSHQATAIALYVAHTYAIEAAEHTPYLVITSPEKRAGKSRLLEVLGVLVKDPLMTGNISVAAVFRTIHERRPTLLIDEYDTVLGSRTEKAEELRGVLNAGHHRGAEVVRMVPQGRGYATQGFEVFCPKALAGIGRLPDTLEDRSIIIRLQRQKPTERAERFRRYQRAEGKAIGAALGESLAPAVELLTEARPEIPIELSDRAADSWEPLFAIADYAGAEWGARARAAAVVLSGGVDPEDESLGVRLLADVRAVFDDLAVDRMLTTDLLAALLAIDDGPWSDPGERRLTPRRLADLLRPYGIRRRDIRIVDIEYAKRVPGAVYKDHGKGYVRADFQDAWERYLPPSNPSKSDIGDTPAQASLPGPSSIGDIGDTPAQASFPGPSSIGDRGHMSPIGSPAKPQAAPALSPVSPMSPVLDGDRGTGGHQYDPYPAAELDEWARQSIHAAVAVLEAAFGDVAEADQFFTLARYREAHTPSMEASEEIAWCGRPLPRSEREPATSDTPRCSYCRDHLALFRREASERWGRRSGASDEGTDPMSRLEGPATP